jgi:hypothetical protein
VPLTPRDRRTLTIGGVVLGVMLLGFLLMNVLSGGGDEEIPSLPTITTSPGGGGGTASPSPTDGISPIPIFTGRDPFSIPPALSPTTSAPTDGTSPTNGTSPTTTSPTNGTTTTLPPTNGTSSPPTQPGGGASEVVGGKTVVLLSVFRVGGEPMVQVEVDGQVFSNIGIGDTFDGGRYELRSVSGDCATFLFGDESFILCSISPK